MNNISQEKPIASRASFGQAVLEMAEEFPQVVVVDADLGKSTKTVAFMNRYPERHIQVGIQEGNMVTLAAGLAAVGKIPFIASFGCFLIGRFEQIRLSVGYSDANVKLVGTHVGVGIGPDGYSQMALEDIASMRTLPNMVVIQPGDHRETKQAVRWAATHRGPVYLRLTRQGLVHIHDDGYRFEMGRADVIQPGKDVALLATGGVIQAGLEAADLLRAKGIHAEVVNLHTIKPIDVGYLSDAAARIGRFVTVEDHSIFGGLGSAVAEVLCEHAPAPLLRVGLTQYGESGTTQQLYHKHGFTGPQIADRIHAFLQL